MEKPKPQRSSARWGIMNKLRRSISAGILLSSTILVGASAQDTSPTSAKAGRVTPGMHILLARISVDVTRAKYLEFLTPEFTQLDANADGVLNQSDIDLHDVMAMNQAQASSASTIMRMDLNSDGYVTEDEIRRAMRYDMRTQFTVSSDPQASQRLVAVLQQIEAMVQTLVELDTDKDGRVSYSEARVLRQGLQRNFRTNDLQARVKQALTLADDGRNELPFINFLSVGEALFQKIDSDGNGVISQQELVNYWKGPTSPDTVEKSRSLETIQKNQITQKGPGEQQQTAQEDPLKAGCKVPAPSANAKVIVLSSYETETLSNVAIGFQDEVVHTGRMTVEPGTDPLYVVVTTYSPTIWQFSGAVHRIERLIMTSLRTGPNQGAPAEPSLVGATGIAEERISFLGRSGCFGYFSEVLSNESINALRDIRKGIGRDPDKVATAYSVLAFSIPSGKTSSAQDKRNRALIEQKGNDTVRVEGDASSVILRGAPAAIIDSLYSYSPGGIANIDVRTVVSSRPAEPYNVLPQQAGLAQLLVSGALKQNRAGEYIVQKPMRFPAGLYGSHSVKFLVPRGIPMPEGDPGHSCVNPEDGPPRGALCS